MVVALATAVPFTLANIESYSITPQHLRGLRKFFLTTKTQRHEGFFERPFRAAFHSFALCLGVFVVKGLAAATPRYEIAFAIVFAGMGLAYGGMLAAGLATHLAQLAFISVAGPGAAVGLGLEIGALLEWAGIKTSMAQEEETATYPSTTQT